MILKRRRLLYWLIKAYLKRWGKWIGFFFLIGLIVFFILLKFGTYILPKIPFQQQETIGIAGEFTIDTLPANILSQVSEGLTTVEDQGTIVPDIAKSWEITNSGRTYTFHLRSDKYFSDGEQLTSRNIDYGFSDVTVTRPDDKTIVMTLKEAYSPFLVTVSRPIFKKGFIGVGYYRIKDIKVNGSFVESLTLIAVKNAFLSKFYHFYPSQEALKTAFALGEIVNAVGLSDLQFEKTSFSTYVNVKTNRTTNFHRLVTLFYNTKDPLISDDKLRGAMSYALPETFSEGVRNYTPYAPSSYFASDSLLEHHLDYTHANHLMTLSQSASESAAIQVKLTTLSKYKNDAEAIAKSWKKIGVVAKIQLVDTVPTTYQIFLGDFIIPKDPDQYTLWHSGQNNNITQYSNLRIDKLLEDGRKTSDLIKRKKIYADFQKYLLADSPASFLYFPYEYNIVRK